MKSLHTEKNLSTYLERADNIEKIVTDGAYTVTVVKDDTSYTILGWRYCKNMHIRDDVSRSITEDANFFKKIDKFVESTLAIMKNKDAKKLMSDKDKHIEAICEKFEYYKSVMEQECAGGNYQFCNLTPWTINHVEDEQIAPEYLYFEKWFDTEWVPAKFAEERIDADMNTKKYFGSTLLEWLIVIIGFLSIPVIFCISYATCGC